MCFFFQAEDGIRDLVRSRGLGDVYKRQAYEGAHRYGARARLHGGERAGIRNPAAAPQAQSTVSYTHLTLPTSDLV